MKLYNAKLIIFIFFLYNTHALQAQITTGVEKIFTNIYEQKLWGSQETVSGSGSTLYETKVIRQEIPRIIQKFNIQSILDIPCGDFNWVHHMELKIPYVGADIVRALIIKNELKYGNNKVHFVQLDILTSDLPYADLILCRDCLVHLSTQQVWQALRNIKRSGAKYLLTTCHIKTKANTNIVTGAWQPLNLLIHPFNFPAPILIIDEGYNNSKALVLWKLEDLILYQ